MKSTADIDPERQFVAEIVAVIEIAALLDQQTARIGAGPAAEPADRRLACQRHDSLSRKPDVLSLLLLAHRRVVDPSPSVADDFVALLDKGADKIGIGPEAPDNAEDADLDVKCLEDAQEAPAADARSIFERRLDHGAARPFIGGKADVRQYALRGFVAFKKRMLATRFDVQIEIDRDPRLARPSRMRRVPAISYEIARRTEIAFGGFASALAGPARRAQWA